MDCNTNFLSVQYLNSTKVVLITFQKPPMFHFIRRVMHIKQTKIPTLCFNMSFLGLLNYHYNKHIVKNNIYYKSMTFSPSRMYHKKNSTRGVWDGPHRFFIKRKPNRVEKPPEPWPMPERAKPCGEHSEGVFFLSQHSEIRFWWDSNSGPAGSATLPGRASQLNRSAFRDT